MAFLAKSLNFAERFLDGLDNKAENAAGPTEFDAPTSEKPGRARRSNANLRAAVSEGGSGPGSQAYVGAGDSAGADFGGVSSEIVESMPGSVRLEGRGQSAPTQGSTTPLRPDGGRLSSDDATSTPSGVSASRLSAAVSVESQPSPDPSNTGMRRRRDSQPDPDASTHTALLHAIQDKDAKILNLTVQNEELRRRTGDLTADLDDAEAEIRALQAERDKSKKTVESLESQIKDSYAEVRTARPRCRVSPSVTAE